uniref:Uncharacterized protein n=1 Tax=Anguilla anguilla TaxID=7936 RepID=A0A0E9WBB5_ANGAN
MLPAMLVFILPA